MPPKMPKTDLLDELDNTLENNAEEFVKNYDENARDAFKAELKRRLNFDAPSHTGSMSSGDVATRQANRMAEEARNANKAAMMKRKKSLPKHGGPAGAIGQTGPAGPAPIPPGQVMASPQVGQLTIATPSPTIDALGHTIIEAFETFGELPPGATVGKLAFVEGIAYIMTEHGWTNLGTALSQPKPVVTDRRGAIRAQKEAKRKARPLSERILEGLTRVKTDERLHEDAEAEA